VLRGVDELDARLTDPENGVLNKLAVNCLRGFPAQGRIVWGARTLDGADDDVGDWKYIPVRRLALMIEESLYRGTRWAVFQPNDEPLWARLRQNVGAYMHRLFRQRAFQGATPREAYYVKCDRELNPPEDRELGIVTVEVGFAPLKPAEFVVIRIQQIAEMA
jgi:phage tail sheath protein FI